MITLIVNHKTENCGVYQYGKRFGHLLQNNKDFYYLECQTQEDFLEAFSKIKPDAIIFNHLTGTMPWLTSEMVQSLKVKNVLTALIVHNVNFSEWFDLYLHQDPFYLDKSGHTMGIPRPLIPFSLQSQHDIPANEFRIGTFGFGFHVKKIPDLCEIVKKEFKKSSKEVRLRIHLTESHYSPNKSTIYEIVTVCNKIMRKSDISLEFTHDFISEIDLLDFLGSNNINLFMYHNYEEYNGIASTLDYALSCKRPIGINESNMFSHFFSVLNNINIYQNKIQDIEEKGFEILQPLYSKWNPLNFASTFKESWKHLIANH